MRKGFVVFQSLAFRLSVAFLAFITGILAVSLWPYHGRSVDNLLTLPEQQTVIETRTVNRESRTVWIYLATPHPISDNTLSLTSMIALYEDGEWLQTDVLAERENGKLKLSRFNHIGVASGTWKQNIKGDVIAKINTCLINAEGLPVGGGHQVTYPLVSHWSLMNGVLRQESSIPRTPHEEFRLLHSDELAANDIDDLLDFAHFSLGSDSKIINRRCLEEDLFFFTE